MFHLFNKHLASSSDTLGTVARSGETVLNEEGFVECLDGAGDSVTCSDCQSCELCC